jgi:hypothetical protein
LDTNKIAGVDFEHSSFKLAELFDLDPLRQPQKFGIDHDIELFTRRSIRMANIGARCKLATNVS